MSPGPLLLVRVMARSHRRVALPARRAEARIAVAPDRRRVGSHASARRGRAVMRNVGEAHPGSRDDVPRCRQPPRAEGLARVASQLATDGAIPAPFRRAAMRARGEVRRVDGVTMRALRIAATPSSAPQYLHPTASRLTHSAHRGHLRSSRCAADAGAGTTGSLRMIAAMMSPSGPRKKPSAKPVPTRPDEPRSQAPINGQASHKANSSANVRLSGVRNCPRVEGGSRRHVDSAPS